MPLFDKHLRNAHSAFFHAATSFCSAVKKENQAGSQTFVSHDDLLLKAVYTEWIEFK